jgi:hypothetical protein
MLLELGDLAILTFLMMNPLSKNSILKQYGLPLGTTTGAKSGRGKKNNCILHTLMHTIALSDLPPLVVVSFLELKL